MKDKRRLTVRFQSRGVSRAIKLSVLGILTTLFIAACGGNAANNTTSVRGNGDPGSLSPASECRMVKHELGETKVCAQPQKVVALGPETLDMLLSLDVQPAGYAELLQIHRGDFNDPSKQIPYLGSRVTSQPINIGVSGEPSLEALSQLKPDLILGRVGENKDEYALLSQIAPTLLIAGRGASEWQRNIQVIAKALERSEQAQKVIEAHNQRLATTRAELAPVIAAHPRLLMLDTNQLIQNIELINSTDYSGALLEELGFQLVSLPGRENTDQTTAISLEVLPQLDADIIIVQGVNFDFGNQVEDMLENQLKQVKSEWKSNAIAQNMQASKEGRVYFVTLYLWRALQGPIGAELIFDELRQLLLGH